MMFSKILRSTLAGEEQRLRDISYEDIIQQSMIKHYASGFGYIICMEKGKTLAGDWRCIRVENIVNIKKVAVMEKELNRMTDKRMEIKVQNFDLLTRVTLLGQKILKWRS